MNKIHIKSESIQSHLFDNDLNTSWFNGWGTTILTNVVTLEKETRIGKLKWYDGNGIPNLKISYSKDGVNYTEFRTFSLDAYLHWTEVECDFRCTYIKLELDSLQGDASISEFEIYEKDENDPEPIHSPVIRNHKGDASKINVNGFPWVSDDVVLSNKIRLYIASQWIWREKGLYINPSYQANINFDIYLKRINDLGIKPILCINQSPDWIYTKTSGNPESKPVIIGNDPTKVESYVPVGKFFFQLGARYGENTFPNEVLEVDTELRWGVKNEKKSGLNYDIIVEAWNEEDGWWRDEQDKFTPEEYAAFLSVCYDGHERKFPYCGFKQASEKPFIMGGISNFNTDYLAKMLDWFKENRLDQKFPSDALNIHHYSNAGNGHNYMPQQWTQGCSPDQDDLRTRLKKVVRWRDQNIPNLPIYYSEFGYDTNPQGNSWQKCFTLENHANWLQRAYLIGLGQGIDQMFMFNLCDERRNDSGDLWQSSGLTKSELQGYTPKSSWYEINNLIRELNGFRFQKEVIKGNVVIQYYRQTSGRIPLIKIIYWSSDESPTRFKYGHYTFTALAKPKFFLDKRDQSNSNENNIENK